MHEPADVVEIALVHDDAAPSGALCLGGRHLDRGVGRHGDDVAPRGHRVRRGETRQFERAGQQLVLLRGDRSVAGRLVEQQQQVGRRVGHRPIVLRLDAEQP